MNIRKWSAMPGCLKPLGIDAAGISATRRAGWVVGGFLAWMLSAATAFAQSEAPLTLNADIPLSYTVQPGDTLWDISALYLRDPWRWQELWAGNPQVDNPHLIYPGDQLMLVWEDGQPRLVRAVQGDVRLSPAMRASPLDLAIPAIPRQHVAPFLRKHRVVGVGALEQAPYVIAGDAGRLISGLGDTLYARGNWEDVRSYRLVRPVKRLEDPVTGELLGVFVLDIGEVARQDVSDRGGSEGTAMRVATMVVTEMREEVRIGDKLLPVTDRVLETVFQPSPPDAPIDNAFMIAVGGGVTQIGALDIVVINRGHRESLKSGDVLAIDQAGQTVQDPITKKAVQLPDTRAGVLMLFGVYERASFGLVLEATRPLAVGDKLRDP